MLGELLITAGVVVLLFVGYQLVWTNVQADRAADAQSDTLERTWEERSPEDPEFDLPLKPGEAFALLRIPRLGEQLPGADRRGGQSRRPRRGVGHYPDTALPGEIGNFSVAGHRATNGEPFAYLDQRRHGDAVVVETGTTWYTYEVYKEYIVRPRRWVSSCRFPTSQTPCRATR